MSRNRRLAFLLLSVLFFTSLAALTLLPQSAFAQPKVQHTPQIIEIILDAAKDAPVKEIDLRPNTPTEFGFDLKNNVGEILGDVTVKVVQAIDGKDLVIAEAKIQKLDQAKALLVQMFDKKKGSPDKVELVGSPPYAVQVHVEAKNLPLRKREFRLVVREPRDYVAPTVKLLPADGELRELRVDIEPKGVNTFIGQHLLPVQLVLGPDLVPTKKGIFKQTLSGPKQKLALVAEEIAFERMLTEGDVYLKVDNYDRAFTYLVKDNASGAIEPRPAGDIRVRINVPRYARPSAKFEAPLEIDGPLSPDYQVHVGLDRTGDTEEIPDSDLQKLDGLRQQKVILTLSPMGKLVCEAKVSDWRPSFDAGDIFSRNVKFRVSVLRLGVKVNLTVAPESRPLVARTETDDRLKDVKSVFALVTLDESAPEGIKLELPKNKEWPAGLPLLVRASIRERKATQAPIARAILIKGKGPKDDKEEIKAEDILAEGVPDPKGKDWIFPLPPQAKPEPLTLSVQFTTATGVKAVKTDTLSILPGGAVKKLYIVKGVVLRGELPQVGLEVILLDVKKKVMFQGKTGEKGIFVFENVEPGPYIVSSKMGFQNLYGEVKLNVPDKDQKELKVTVSLLAK